VKVGSSDQIFATFNCVLKYKKIRLDSIFYGYASGVEITEDTRQGLTSVSRLRECLNAIVKQVGSDLERQLFFAWLERFTARLSPFHVSHCKIIQIRTHTDFQRLKLGTISG
jgi:hypothetical protein